MSQWWFMIMFSACTFLMNLIMMVFLIINYVIIVRIYYSDIIYKRMSININIFLGFFFVFKKMKYIVWQHIGPNQIK